MDFATKYRLNRRVDSLKNNRDRANSALEKHRDQCEHCARKACIVGMQLFKQYEGASRKLNGAAP
jgi:hypothetical protein